MVPFLHQQRLLAQTLRHAKKFKDLKHDDPEGVRAQQARLVHFAEWTEEQHIWYISKQMTIDAHVDVVCGYRAKF